MWEKVYLSKEINLFSIVINITHLAIIIIMIINLTIIVFINKVTRISGGAMGGTGKTSLSGFF